jgi:hypothetical protein
MVLKGENLNLGGMKWGEAGKDCMKGKVIKLTKMRRARHVARTEEMRNSYQVLVGKPESNKPLRRYRRTWKDNIGMEFRELGWEGLNWVHLAQGKDKWRCLVNMVINLQVS